jgi:pimeloyl-ACP methyl ester carboxylesterase
MANYPRPSGTPPKAMPKVKCPVLVFHGLTDKALLGPALNDTWEWVDNELTLLTIPAADHFVQQGAADLVTERILGWLLTRKGRRAITAAGDSGLNLS